MASTDDRGLKRFNGEEDDPGRQLRKWRSWAMAKMYTMEKLTAKQQGPFLYTLLDGKALEALEHLELEKLQVENGAQVVLEILRERFPEKEAHDQMGEALGEVFGLAAREGESVQQWTARVVEVFTKCRRKAEVAFPSQAQGWIALNCAGLSEEQKAIIKAKAQGKLDIESVSSAMRSCFPLYKAGTKARRPVATLAAETESPGEPDEFQDFQDVEAFLADNEIDLKEESGEPIPEAEAAEALAASWKERRSEISRLKKDRRFDAAQTSRKHFRVEIEELKRRTRCRRCGKIGHWAKECRSGGGTRSSPSTSTTTSAEAQLVEHHEVSLAQILEESDDLEVNHIAFVGNVEPMGEPMPEALLVEGLVSSPGFGVVDSGCGRTLIGRATLEAVTRKLQKLTRRRPEVYKSVNAFRFGNGATESSTTAVRIPVGLNGIPGLIDAAVIEGRAPLLLGRPTLERLKVALDFSSKTMSFLDEKHMVPMRVNSAGQLLIDLLSFPKKRNDKETEAVSVAAASRTTDQV